jgi:uncharacterized protein YlbG (UPF0298 family)
MIKMQEQRNAYSMLYTEHQRTLQELEQLKEIHHSKNNHSSKKRDLSSHNQ